MLGQDGDVAGFVVLSDRGSQSRPRKILREPTHHDLVVSIGQVTSAGEDAAMENFFSLPPRNVLD